MRTSGSLKSLIHGITTDKSKAAHPAYLKEQVNMQTVTGSGLHKRPPLELLALDIFPTYINDATYTSYVKSFTLRSIEYLLMVKQLKADLTINSVLCAKYDGTLITLDEDSKTYFTNMLSVDDIDFTVQGDRVFVLNKKANPAMDAALRETAKVSLLHITNAPNSDTTLTVSFQDTASTTFTVSHPVGTTPAGRGTDVVAAAIRDLINGTAAVGVTASARGAVVAVTRTDDEYAAISVEDDLGGQGARAINGKLTDINDLPRYITGDQVLIVAPEEDIDRGTFYMASEEDSGASAPTVPASDGEFVSGTLFYNPDTSRYHTGVNPASGYGSWTTNLVINSLAAQEFIFRTNWNGTGLHYIFFAPAGGASPIGWPSGSVGRVTVRRKSDLAVVFDSALSAADEVPWGTGYAYQKVITPSVTLSAGTSYYIYINKVVAGGSTLKAVNWNESSAPEEQFQLDSATMPHSLTKSTDTSLTIDPIEWDEKGAGDNETNPTPEFVGNTIADLAIFQNRLVSLVKDEVATTETDNTQSWWRNTVTQLLATHPVRLRSTSSKGGDLTSAVYHNQDLLLFTNERQYKLTGNIPLTPATAGLPQTSAYINVPKTRPESVGNKVFFTFDYGQYTGVSQFKADENDALVDRADPITDHAKKYIKGTPFKILGDANTGELFLITKEGSIYVCDYDTQISRDENTRWAWSHWTDFATTGEWTIIDAVMVNRDIQLVLDKDNMLTTVKIDTVEDPDATEKKVYLDFLNKSTVSAGTVTLPANYPYTSELVLTVDDAAHIEYGNVIEYTESSGVLTVDTSYNGVNVAYGFPFRASMKPNTIFIRDEGGLINSFTRLTIQQWLVHLNRSADVYAKIISNYYDGDDQYWSGLISGDINTLTDKVADNTSVFKVAFKQRADLADLELYSEGHLPWSITQVEWLGNYSSRGRRF